MNSYKGKKVDFVTIIVTYENKDQIENLFIEDRILTGEVDNAIYTVNMFGVNHNSMGELQITIESYVDSQIIIDKSKKEILRKLGVSNLVC